MIAVAITTSFPIVLATATPKMNGPKKLATAVMARATRGERAREEIMVATTLLESCTPFRKSKMRARTITAIRIGVIYAPFQRCRCSIYINNI